MTYSEFLGRLAAKGNTGKWFFYGAEKALRHRVNLRDYGEDVHADPLTFVYILEVHKFYFPMNWVMAAQELGMDIEVARNIVFAADNFPGHNVNIRKELISAVGLKDLPQ